MSRGILYLRTRYRFKIERLTVISKPGPAVDIKQARIDVPVTQPYNIMIALGGISNPKMDDTVSSAVAYPRG